MERDTGKTEDIDIHNKVINIFEIETFTISFFIFIFFYQDNIKNLIITYSIFSKFVKTIYRNLQ